MNSLSLILRILTIVAAVAAGAIFYVSKGKLAEKQTQLEASQAATKATQAELAMDNERTTWVRAGFEKRLAKVLMNRGGTEQGINNLDDDKITVGTGLDIRIQNTIRIKADFTYVMDPIKDSQRFSFSLHF